jgi:hypothetical protein
MVIRAFLLIPILYGCSTQPGEKCGLAVATLENQITERYGLLLSHTLQGCFLAERGRIGGEDE